MSVSDTQTGSGSDVETERSADDGGSSEGVFLPEEDARRVQRKAIARQKPGDAKAAVGVETTIEGNEDFFDQLFDENGMAFDSWWEWQSFDDDPLWDDSYKNGEKRRAPINNPRECGGSVSVSPDDDPEAFLEEVNPEKLAEIEEKFSNLPGTREELIRVQAKREAKELDDDEITQEAGLVITKHQDEREDIWGAVDTDEDEQEGEECPECGSTNTSSYQQQTGGADEGMTSFHKCGDCGKSWRGGYGG